MNQATYIDIRFQGADLSPRQLAEQLKLPIEPLVTSGDIGKTGRYRGKPVPYGIGLLKIEPTIEAIGYYADLLSQRLPLLKNHCIDELIIDVDLASSPANDFVLSAKLMQKLSAIEARIQFHYASNDKLDLKLARATQDMK